METTFGNRTIPCANVGVFVRNFIDARRYCGLLAAKDNKLTSEECTEVIG